MEKISTTTNHPGNQGSDAQNLSNNGDKKTSNGNAGNFIGNKNQHSDSESLVSENDLLFDFLHPHPTSAKNNHISIAAQNK
jgi:hypothetical protein